MISSYDTSDSRNSTPPSRIRIAAFGHRGVGKSTYLTVLYAMLVNNIYRDIDFEYTNDDSAAKLSEYLNTVSENYSNTRDLQLPPTVSMPQELHFLLRRKGVDYHINLIDYRGESTTIGEMTQNKDLLDFFATCDGLMLFNSNEADEEDQTLRRINHLARHQDLKYLFSNLKNRSGKQKLQLPVAMVYTKSDKIDFGNSSLDDWIEENNSSLMETLRKYVQTFKTVFLSSQMAFMNLMKDDRFRLTETERSGGTVKCDTDVAYPLFWLIDQIQSPIQVLEATTKIKSSSRLWKTLIGAILIICIFGYMLLFYSPNSVNLESPTLTNEGQGIPSVEPTPNNNSYINTKSQKRISNSKETVNKTPSDSLNSNRTNSLSSTSTIISKPNPNDVEQSLKIVEPSKVQVEQYKWITCNDCRGGGQIQANSTCSTCNGLGNSICSKCYGQKKYNCSKCNGEKRLICSSCKGQKYFICSSCKGSGRQSFSDGVFQCDLCDGSGKTPCDLCDRSGYLPCYNCGQTGNLICNKCDRTGKIKCNTCHGKGQFLEKIVCSSCTGKGQIQVKI